MALVALLSIQADIQSFVLQNQQNLPQNTSAGNSRFLSNLNDKENLENKQKKDEILELSKQIFENVKKAGEIINSLNQPNSNKVLIKSDEFVVQLQKQSYRLVSEIF